MDLFDTNKCSSEIPKQFILEAELSIIHLMTPTVMTKRFKTLQVLQTFFE